MAFKLMTVVLFGFNTSVAMCECGWTSTCGPRGCQDCKDDGSHTFQECCGDSLKPSTPALRGTALPTLPLLRLPSCEYDDSCFLDGDVTKSAASRGYPAAMPSQNLHGAAAWNAYSTTNNFTRHWSVHYNTLSLKGEPKHGLWRWKQTGAEAEVWWCLMSGQGVQGGWGGATDAQRSASGLSDSLEQGKPVQSRLEPLWQYIRGTSRANQFGPLGVAAKLDSMAQTAVQMELSPFATLWFNRGTTDRPAWSNANIERGAVEYYVFEAYFILADARGNSLFSATPCDACSLNLFVAAVLRPQTPTLHGLTNFGVHYARFKHGSGDACPSECGVVPCDCDAVLVDLSMDGQLEGSWNDERYFLPTWTAPQQLQIGQR